MLCFVESRATPTRVDQDAALERGAARLAALGPKRPAPVLALHEAPQLVVHRRDSAEPTGRAHRRRELVIAHLAEHQGRDRIGERLEVEQRGRRAAAAVAARRRRAVAADTALESDRVRAAAADAAARRSASRAASRSAARAFSASASRASMRPPSRLSAQPPRRRLPLVADLPHHLLRDLGVFLAHVARVARGTSSRPPGHGRRALVRILRTHQLRTVGKGGGRRVRGSDARSTRTRASGRRAWRIGRRVARGRTHSFWWYRS